ncbi:programmed cell death protein 2 isoform X1 [Armigeres subalbatus]|uniref:programmed cell death protein 2 isoform X1 n=1 Tax=Armigeres subalbatus TaxID=124917 RepID=UPI002ED36A51
METAVDLGFLEPCEEWLLANKFFRSKVGGKPAWLELKNIPIPKDLLCDGCEEPCIFLCQVYAPLEDQEKCFHRMLYLFVCSNASCYQVNQSKNIKVLRSQLPRSNDHYDFDPPKEDKPSEPVPSPVPLCVVCGCRGPQQCSKCRKVNYCGVVHQRLDWKQNHKAVCGATTIVDNKNQNSNILFPQYEIVTEPEEIEQTTKLTEEENVKKQMEEYDKLVEQGKIGELSEVSESEMDTYAEQLEDKHFEKFKQRVAFDPDQVLRYDRKGKPLWLSPIVPSEIPDCELCHGPRVFEFQIMPQLLNSLKNENIDWGTLAIFTCEQSCSTPDNCYIKEYVFKQDVISTEQPKPLETST